VRLQLDDEKENILGMQSAEKEKVPFTKGKQRIEKEPERTLNNVQNTMINQLNYEMGKGVQAYKDTVDRKDFVCNPNHYGQIVATVA